MRHEACVLVVESDPSLRASIAEVLSEAQLRPTVASCVDAALEQLSGGCVPDCILVDLDAAWREERFVLARLHAHPEAEEVPVLALGSRPGPLMSAGADGVMLKPLDLGALPRRIAGLCDCAPMQ
jgi:DNA-binding response OmpR family regulator